MMRTMQEGKRCWTAWDGRMMPFQSVIASCVIGVRVRGMTVVLRLAMFRDNEGKSRGKDCVFRQDEMFDGMRSSDYGYD